MPTLLNTLQVSQMAFKWGITTRVYRTHTLKILAREDRKDWQLSNGSYEQAVQGVWLSFQIASTYIQRVSPQSSAGNDWIDVKNALLDPTKQVDFYPIYSVDNTIAYPALSNEGDQTPLLQVKRGLQKPSISMNIKAQHRLDAYPGWLRKTRQY